MKKLLMTTAVLSVLATPALADLMVGGDFVWSYQDNDGATSTAVDADINFKPSMTTDKGLTVSADFNINQDGEDDGDNSMTISNDQFSLDLGDTNSALDAIDDVTDFTYVLGNGSPSADHAAILSISPLAGLTIHLSGAADSNYDSGAAAGHAYSASYDLMGHATIGAGQMINDDDSEATLMNITGSVAGINLGYELHTDTTAAGVDTDTTTMGATYTMGATTFGVESMKAESQGTVSSDEMTYGIHHAIAPGLVVFAEYTNDDKTASEETTAAGFAMKF
jgi:hypothetical protein